MHLHRARAAHRADHARHRVGVPAAVERLSRGVDVDALEGGREVVEDAYSIAQGFDLAYDEDKVADRDRAGGHLAPRTSRPSRASASSTTTQLEVYVDYWHFDEDQIAAYANPTSFSMPWEILAAMDDVVFEQRRAAYSDTAAARYSVPWLSLVHEPRCRPGGPDAAPVRAPGHGPRRGVPVRRPDAGHARGGRRPLPGGTGLVRRSTATWSSATARSSSPRFDPAAQFARARRVPRRRAIRSQAGDFALGHPPTICDRSARVDPIPIGQDAADPGHRRRDPGRSGCGTC